MSLYRFKCSGDLLDLDRVISTSSYYETKTRPSETSLFGITKYQSYRVAVHEVRIADTGGSYTHNLTQEEWYELSQLYKDKDNKRATK